MKLEDRMRQSIRRRSGTVVLRSDVAALGGRTQCWRRLKFDPPVRALPTQI